MTRYIDADAFADDLEYDVEQCARALDDMNMVGKERDDMQWEKDCKQNCIWYISEQPTVDAVPVVRCKDCKYYEEQDETIGTCLLTESGAHVKGYCSWAEVKDE